MDLNISRWILDFILRQPSLDDMTLDKLLGVLPLPTEDPGFKKALLLRRIVSEISKGVASEEMLLLMERIEELDSQAGLPASQALRTAYCDVAVDFTARLLEGTQPNNYSGAVNTIWVDRVGSMMDSHQNVGLLSDDLRNWKYDIEASVERADDSSLFSEDDDDLLKKWRGAGYETLKSVRVYVEEAWANMGPSFLEQVAQIVGRAQIREVLYPHRDQGQQHRCRISHGVAAAVKRSAEMVKRSRILHPMRKCSRGAKLSSDISDEMGDSSVKETVESVGPSMAAGDKEVIDLELENENVIDLELENGASKKKNENENVIDLELENGDQNDAGKKKNEKATDLEFEIGDVNDTSKGKNENETGHKVNDTSKGKNENETGHNVNDTSKGKNPNETGHNVNDCGLRVLPASHVYSSCPLKRKDMNLQNGMRRRRKFWSNLEEDTLVNAVKLYGVGNWKFILKQYKDIFDERTEGDLKDKWRNLIR